MFPSYFLVRIQCFPSHRASIKLSSTIARKIRASLSAVVFITSHFKIIIKNKINKLKANESKAARDSESGAGASQTRTRSNNSVFVRGLLLRNITPNICCFLPCVGTNAAPDNYYLCLLPREQFDEVLHSVYIVLLTKNKIQLKHPRTKPSQK